MFSLPVRTRRRWNILITLVGGFIFIRTAWHLSPSWDLELESDRLEKFMNEPVMHKEWTSKTTFHWRSVKPKYPAGKLRPLPRPAPKAVPPIQQRFRPESTASRKTREMRRREVREVFKKNWASYRQYAWMKDALLPLSAGYKDQFSGWAATLVDSLDTLWIMGLKNEFNEAVDAVAGIDFGSSTSGSVNTFETNIRYLGGLLAAYDLSNRPVLLAKATELGDLLYAGFNTPNRMPVDFISFEYAKTGEGLQVEDQVVSASPGSISMEFTRLSQLTGDPKYYDAISRITDLFAAHQNETMLPGMWPVRVSMRNEDVITGTSFSLGSYADSMYEYTVKTAGLLGLQEPVYEKMSRYWMDTAKQNLFFRPMVPGGEDILISGNLEVGSDGKPVLDPESEHLACFLGGIYALGGKLFRKTEYVDIGTKLALGCAYAYKSMPTGIMPERFNMAICPNSKSCKWDQEVWDREKAKRPEWREGLPLGFTTAKDPRYILRPEAIESLFVLYRTTGRREFQEAAWDMFTAVNKGTSTDIANAAVRDVTSRTHPLEQEDYMESFWLAETMKYFYLVFSPPDLISLDEFVLNTEAHPFRRPRR